MTSEVASHICIVLLLAHFHCFIANPTTGILSESNLYLAQIIELNSTKDDFYLIYHHDDPVYSLQSFTSDNLLSRVYICSPSTIYTLDLQLRAPMIVPLLSIDDTPCRSSLTYLSNETVLLWTLRHEIVQVDFPQMSKTFLWNSTSTILNMIHNDSRDFYLSVQISDAQSSILHCRFNRSPGISPYQSCLFLDYGYHHISALAIDNNRLYIADRIEKKIYILTLSSNRVMLTKTILPLNTSTIADIQSMLIYNHSLIWLTTSGHVRIVSLETYRVRNLFWFDEQLRAIGLITFSQWLNRTSTSKTTIITTSASERIDTTATIDIDHNPWKIAAYITSIILGFVLFLSSILATCLILNYRLERPIPNSFTNACHLLNHRTIATIQPFSDDSLT